ncbi:hypothetical protein SynROS8604_01120 [Synechococcus sp. ROS8604]|nr:hypothetical protein SynROS8604_01120 [Synechococcus sp. ROS8604]
MLFLGNNRCRVQSQTTRAKVDASDFAVCLAKLTKGSL